MRTVSTIQGDVWDMISFREYGDEKQMHVLIDANPDHRDVTFFSAGVEINIPEIKIKNSTPAPPWVD